MSANLASLLGTGLTPQQFIDGMTRNQNMFLDWYHRFAWKNAGDKSFFTDLTGRHDAGQHLRCVILMADWCGDVVRNVPVVLRAMEAAQVPVEILILEEHLDLMDEHFLVLGGRSIPVVLFVDASGSVIAKWGPRPAHIQEPMVAFKVMNPDKSAPDYADNLKAARAELMRRYGDGIDYQTDIIKELRTLLT